MNKTLSLPEGTDRKANVLRSDADSLVGKRVVVRELQYGVREGREAGEVVIIPKAFIADRDSCFILLEVTGGEE